MMTRRDTRQLSLLLLIDGGAPPQPQPLADAQIADLFTEWYAKYPRKKHPNHAIKAFARVLRAGEATIDQLTEGRDRYVEECRRNRTEPRFTLHPATWLNAGAWLNEPDAPAPISRTAASLARVGAALGHASRTR